VEGHVSVTKEDPTWLGPTRQKFFLDLDPLDWLSGKLSLGEKAKFLVFIREFIFYGQLALLNCCEEVIKKCMHSLFLSARLKDFK